MRLVPTWDVSMLRLARFWAQERSKDPSTQVCAVVTDPTGKRVRGMGFNGFPPKLGDLASLYNDRETKLRRVVHAEVNAIHDAGLRYPSGATVFVWPLFPCEHCALQLLAVGVRRVVSMRFDNHPRFDDWGESWNRSASLFDEADVRVSLYDEAALDQPDIPNLT